jgi:predicted MPP superfamily phosphohydrolase
MLIFLSLYFCIYGALHLYVLIKARRAFYLRNPGYLLLVVILAFLMFAPIQARMLEAEHYPMLSIMTFWIGNVWMGALFFFICLSVPLDGYHLGLAALQQLSQVDLTHLMLSRRQRFGLIALLTIVLMAYSAVEAYRIRPDTLTLKSSKIPAAVKSIRIVQISDLHVGPMTFPLRLKPVIEAVKAAKPDILVSTGDLVDGRMPPFRAEQIAALAGITAPLGKFAVTGNHEYYAGLKESLAFTGQAGFTMLRSQHVLIKDALAIAGVDDPGHGGVSVSEQTVLDHLVGKYFTVLLKHRPVFDPSSRDLFDLQLSGHIHKGQIFPFTLVIDLLYKWDSGTHQISPKSLIHVSRGSGSWGPPFRFLAPPEITIIDLQPAESQPAK